MSKTDNVTPDKPTLIHILRRANQLKRAARTGWAQRGVPDAENVAAHSYGTAFTALLLAQLVEASLDMGKLLTMAILHDLPEALTTDIPAPAWRYLPAGVKMTVERKALEEIWAGVTFGDDLTAVWEELHQQESIEARLVDDADKLDLYLQALIYEEQSGNRHLAEFWARPHAFHLPQSQALYDALYEERAALLEA